MTEPPSRSTISGFLVPNAKRDKLEMLERYRLAWEAEHGPTDLTRYYTSRWPDKEQEDLCQLDVGRYYDGLPPFVQEMLRDMGDQAARSGNMDFMPADYIRLYLTRFVKKSGELPRGR